MDLLSSGILQVLETKLLHRENMPKNKLSGILKPISIHFNATQALKFPPAESPAIMTRFAVEPKYAALFNAQTYANNSSSLALGYGALGAKE